MREMEERPTAGLARGGRGATAVIALQRRPGAPKPDLPESSFHGKQRGCKCPSPGIAQTYRWGTVHCLHLFNGFAIFSEPLGFALSRGCVCFTAARGRGSARGRALLFTQGFYPVARSQQLLRLG